MQHTPDPFLINLPATKRSEGAWVDVAKRRAEETIHDMRGRLQGALALVVLKFDESELLPPFVRAYFSTLARMFKEQCEPATLVVDISNASRVRYWLDGLMREEGVLLLAYAHPSYHLFGVSPPYTEEVFYSMLHGTLHQKQLVSQLEADEVTVAKALRYLVDYRVIRPMGDGYQLLVPKTLDAFTR